MGLYTVYENIDLFKLLKKKKLQQTDPPAGFWGIFPSFNPTDAMIIWEL